MADSEERDAERVRTDADGSDGPDDEGDGRTGATDGSRRERHPESDRGHQHGDGSDSHDTEHRNDHGDHDGHDQDHHHDHDHHRHDLDTLGAAVVTISSTRTVDDDPSGDVLCDSFRSAGHEVATRELLADDLDGIQRTVVNVVDRGDVDVVVTTGGTGVTPDDVTIEAIGPLFAKELPGFGELFRRRSEAEIGTRAMATRATAGIVNGVPVFSLPGSKGAVQLGVELVLAEAGHVAGLARRGEETEE